MNITAKYLTKVFDGGVYALNGFTVDIPSGSVVSVLGESGCGKTTLLRILSGLEKPTAGELYLDGVFYKDSPIKQRDTAVVFQDYILYPRMTVWENVAIALDRYGLPRDEEEKRVRAVLNDLELLKFKNQLPRYLSGGQQQRVAIARAIVRDPSLILFDEPLSNIAQEQRDEYIALIAKVCERLPQTTVVYVTHNPREAMIVGDYLLVMNNGKCVQFGKKERVWKYPYSRDVLETLIGDAREVEGTVKNGVFTKTAEPYIPYLAVENAMPDIPDTMEFDTDYAGKATVVYNTYDDGKKCLFDGDGAALIGEKRRCFFDGTFDGKTLRFCGIEYKPNEDFRLRFFGEYGNVKVGVNSIALRFVPRPGDIEFAAENDGDKFIACGNEFTLYSDGFCGKLYVSPDDIELFDPETGKRTLAHYRVYKQESVGKIVPGGKLHACGGVMDYFGPERGKVSFSVNRKAKITAVKKGGIRAECLDEETLGTDGEKLVYCSIKGFPHYVAFYADKYEHFLGVKKLRIKVSGDGITVNRDGTLIT